MKKYLFIIFCGLFALQSCRKSAADTTVSEASVVGFRGETCLCCSGNLIKIGNDTLQFEKFPENTPKFTPVYPYNVRVEWQRDTSVCSRINGKLIILTKFQLL